MYKLSKVVLLAYIGETIVSNLNTEMEGYAKIREAIDFCWEWLEGKRVNEERIYEFLDDEDEDDLVGYMLYADNERTKKEYGIILGVVSYISHHILEAHKSPIPQFLSGTDDKYYDLVIADAVELNVTDCMDKVVKYCEAKIAGNDLKFGKAEIMELG